MITFMKHLFPKCLAGVLVAGALCIPAFASVERLHKANARGVSSQIKEASSRITEESERTVRCLSTRQAPSSKSLRTAAKRANVPGSGPISMAPRADLNIPAMRGFVAYADSWGSTNKTGIYNLPTTADGKLTMVWPITVSGSIYGGIELNGVYYTNEFINIYGQAQWMDYHAYDMETGEKIASGTDQALDKAPFGGFAFDPTNGDVYGITQKQSSYSLSKYTFTIDGDELTETYTDVVTLSTFCDLWNAIAIDGQGQVYAISRENITEKEVDRLYKIDKTTGECTLIGDTGETSIYITGATIDANTGRMFWVINTSGDASYLCEVNLQTGAATRLMEYKDNEEIVNIYVPAPEATPKAPAELQDVSVEFENGSLSGNVTVKTPSTLFDGSAPAQGETLSVYVEANGVVVASKENVEYDSTVTIPVTLSEAGFTNLSIYGANQSGNGPKTRVKNMFVGIDTPAATSATLTIEGGNNIIEWKPVTGSVNGGYIDVNNLTYTVWRYQDNLNDPVLVVKDYKETSYIDEVGLSDQLISYHYEVFAVCDDMQSAPAVTNYASSGMIVPPYSVDFSKTQDVSAYTIADANGDGIKWKYSALDNGVYVGPNTSSDMDDWFISPNVKFEADKMYEIEVTTWAKDQSNTERLEVKVGMNPTPEGMTTEVVAPAEITGLMNSPTTLTGMLATQEAGIYYVGFHGISDANRYNLFIGGWSIKEIGSSRIPNVPTDFSVVPGEYGALNAKISFKAPSINAAGGKITSLTKIELMRGDELIKTFESPVPGELIEYTDNLKEAGNVDYTVIPYSSEGKGLSSKATVYVGVNLPGDVTEATIARTSAVGEVIVTWDPVTVDVNGYPLKESDVTYSVYQMDGNSGTLKAKDLTALSYTYQPVGEGQDFVQCAVFANTVAGRGAGKVTEMIPVGTPYNGEYESFANGAPTYLIGVLDLGGTVVLCNDNSLKGVASADGDNGFIAAKCNYVGSGSAWLTGLISLAGMDNPGFSFYTNNMGGDDDNTIEVAVRADGEKEYTIVQEATPVRKLVESTGWGQVIVPLKEYKDKTIEIKVTSITQSQIYTPFDNLIIGSLKAHDVAVCGISAPSVVAPANAYEVEVSVANHGTEPVSDYSIELYEDGKLLKAIEGPALDICGTSTVKFDLTMSPVAEDAISYYAQMVLANDEDESNDKSETVTVSVGQNLLPAPTNLIGEIKDGQVELTWDEPEIPVITGQVTDDFEDASSFSNLYGNWIFVDLDNSPVGGFDKIDIPGIDHGKTTGSFWVWDQDIINNEYFEPHSGSKFLFSMYRVDGGTANDWAISPVLSGEAQTITFYAMSYDSYSPEKLMFFYSTGTTDLEDFEYIPGGGTVPASWTKYSVDVPEGAKRFAICSCARDAFMLMIDDFTYIPDPEANKLQLEGYNVYRNGIKLNEEPLSESKYADVDIAANSTYRYSVTGLYKGKGESAGCKSIEVNTDMSGVENAELGKAMVSTEYRTIVVANSTGRKIGVSSIDGLQIYSGRGEGNLRISVPTGIYLVTIDDDTVKVTVK